MNRVEIAGGLTRDARFRYTESGLAVFDCTVAVNGARYSASEKRQVVTTVYVAVDAIGWLAEQLAELGLSTGDEVMVVGELNQWEKELADGKKERKTRVRVLRLDVMRKRHQAAQQDSPVEDVWA